MVSISTTYAFGHLQIEASKKISPVLAEIPRYYVSKFLISLGSSTFVVAAIFMWQALRVTFSTALCLPR